MSCCFCRLLQTGLRNTVTDPVVVVVFGLPSEGLLLSDIPWRALVHVYTCSSLFSGPASYTCFLEASSNLWPVATLRRDINEGDGPQGTEVAKPTVRISVLEVERTGPNGGL